MRTIIIITGVLFCAAITYAATDWRSAERKVEDFKKEHEQLRTLTPEETRKIVTAICEAEEADPVVRCQGREQAGQGCRREHVQRPGEAQGRGHQDAGRGRG